jgi:inosine triphosphate pyrophosphatase
MDKIIYVTGNAKKFELAERFITLPMERRDIDLIEIQSLSFEEIVEHKVKEAYRLVQEPVMVQDGGVCYNALGGLPGPLVKWFVQALGSKRDLCQLLDPYEDRSAIAVACVGFYDGTHLKIIKATANGHVAKVPTDNEDRWHGWSDSFIYEGTDKPWAELTKEEQGKVSMTGVALRHMEEYLKTLT